MRALAAVCVVAMAWSGAARADGPSFSLSPVWSDAPVQRPLAQAVPVPTTGNPVEDVRVNTFLIGMGLAGAGLVLGGAGFAILEACGEGSSCHNNTTTTIGWVLAAPGLIPLAVGLGMMYFTYGNTGGRRGRGSHSATPHTWVLTAGPLPGGVMVGGLTAF